LYQFNKSLFEILNADDDTVIMLEGQIEDIDIVSQIGTETTIQCKYHEDKKFQMSSVIKPILEMFSHFAKSKVTNRRMKYILYAHFDENVDNISQIDFKQSLMATKEKETLLRYFPSVFNINDESILILSTKKRKSDNDKKAIVQYFIDNKSSLSYKADLTDFFNCFEYRKAEKYDDLKQNVISLFQEDNTTSENFCYSNAFAKIAELSSLANPELRKISKNELLNWLANKKTILLNKWIFEISDKKKILKTKKDSLTYMFSANRDIRVFVFSKSFLDNNENSIIPFIREYIGKYNKKPLQTLPIFVVDADIEILQNIVMELYEYQILINTGNVIGNNFVEDDFVNNTSCSHNILAKITLKNNINCETLQKCKTAYLFYIGNEINPIMGQGFETEVLGISTIAELKYLTGICKTLTEVTK